MDEGKRLLVQGWLEKARRDLESAGRLAAGSSPILDSAIYHCQQAAEKAIKGYLTFCDRRFVKTHDIEVLVGLAAEYEPRFAQWIDVAADLTPYAAAFRYPGDVLAPDSGEFEEALRLATRLFQFVLSVLPREVHPAL